MSYLDQLKQRHGKAVGSGDVAVSCDVTKELDVDMEQRLVTGVITSDAVDLSGEVVMPKGCDRSYIDKMKVVLVGHDHALPVGKMRWMTIKSDKIRAQTYIPRIGSLHDDTLLAVKEGLLPAHSIGFKTNNFGPPTADEEDEYGKSVYGVHREWMMLEYSFVSQPCNPDALVDEKGVRQLSLAVSKGLIRRTSAVVFGLPDTPQRKWWPVTEVVVS